MAEYVSAGTLLDLFVVMRNEILYQLRNPVFKFNIYFINTYIH